MLSSHTGILQYAFAPSSCRKHLKMSQPAEHLAISETTDDLGRGALAIPIHGLDSGNFLGAVGVFGEQFVRIRLVLELRHDFRSAIFHSEDSVVPPVEVEDFPDLVQYNSTNRCPYF